MSRRRHILTEVELKALNRTADFLKIKQEDLAEVAGVSQAWLSITLSGKRVKREVENLGRLAEALLDLFQKKQDDLGVQDRQSDEFSNVLKRLVSLSIPGNASFISPPGRPVPAKAQNYLRRPVDDLVDKCLKTENLSLYIAGPFQAGKTSLLLRLRDEAKKKGFQTAYFSCKSLAKPRLFSDSAHVFRLYAPPSEGEAEKETYDFFRSLQEKLTNAWGLEASPQLDADDFPNWVDQRLNKFGPNHQALIVLDDLGYLSPSLIYKISSDLRVVKNTHSFVSFARGLVVGSPRVLEYMKEEEKLMATPMVSSVSPITEKGDWWFEFEQLKDLFKRLGSTHKEAQIRVTHERYGGQPLLSHLIAVNAGLDIEDTKFNAHLKEFESEWSVFERHKNLVRETLVEAAFMYELRSEGIPDRLPQEELLTKLTGCYPELLKRIMERTKGSNADQDNKYEFVRPYLEARNIICVRRDKVEFSCKWYQEIAEQLEKDLNDKKVVIKLEE